MATGRIEMSLDREGTSMSMVSNHSHLSRRSHNSQISQYGPLSRQALQRHTKVRVKSSKGTRYVIKFNSVRFKVETIDDGHESDHSIVDRSHRQKRSRTHWGHFRRSKTDVSDQNIVINVYVFVVCFTYIVLKVDSCGIYTFSVS